MKPNWHVTEIDEKLIRNLAESLKIDRITAQILCSRDLSQPTDARRFLNPSVSQLHSPFLMKNMHEAVALLRETVSSKKRVGIFSDSDLDGLTSLTLMNTLFSRIGLDVFYYFPNEENSDYGLTPSVTDVFLEQKIDVLITLDCGIRDVDEVSRFREAGIDVIICDHHEPDEVLPEAVIVNPKQHDCPYPFKELAGVGVAFKLLQAFMYSYLPLYEKHCVLIAKEGERFDIIQLKDGILESEVQSFFYPEEYSRFADSGHTLFYLNLSPIEVVRTGAQKAEPVESLAAHTGMGSYEYIRSFINKRQIPETPLIYCFHELFLEISFNIPEKCRILFSAVLPYVAIGTIADVVPVVDENRILITQGIALFNESSDPALQRLKNHVKKEIDPKVIGWQIAPLLNSPGRFGKTELTADFFTGNSSPEDIFSTINEINEYRKDYVAKMFHEIIQEHDGGGEDIIFVMRDDIEGGVTGLLASRLNEYYNKPAIVAALVDGQLCKGSGRSKNLSIFPFIEKFSDLFLRFGGHQQAFGFTIEQKNLQLFGDAVSSIKLSDSALQKGYTADIELDYRDLSYSMIQDILKLAPFGVDNENPLFLSRKVPVVSVSAFGKNSEHGRILTDRKNLEIVGWRMARIMEEAAEKGVVDVLFHPEINNYYGKSSLRMMLCDID